MNTLVTEPFYEAVPRFLGISLEELYQAKDHQAFLAFERGEIDEEDYAQRFFIDRRPLDTAGLKRTMTGAYRFMDGVEPLLAELKASGYPMYALSNYSCWYTLIEEKLALSRYLAWDFVSCRTGLRKPAAEAYRFAAERLGVSPSQCVFVDDREKNVVGARSVDMQAILREGSTDQLREKLRVHGVDVGIPSARS